VGVLKISADAAAAPAADAFDKKPNIPPAAASPPNPIPEILIKSLREYFLFMIQPPSFELNIYNVI
jgi:hypothetical protein